MAYTKEYVRARQNTNIAEYGLERLVHCTRRQFPRSLGGEGKEVVSRMFDTAFLVSVVTQELKKGMAHSCTRSSGRRRAG